MNMIFLLLFLFFFIIQSVAFVTLFERHVLSLSQSRLGPNKVSFMGLVQAIMDGIKLLTKEQLLPIFSSKIMFIIIPSFSFVIMGFYWMVTPFFYNFSSNEMTMIIFLCIVGSFVYTTLLSGVFSKSKYGFIGSLRSSAQSISYEISFSFFFLCFLLESKTFSMESMFFNDLIIIFFPLMISMICELNRAPFDLSESESELVSGFNTEFSSVAFVLLFLSEYGILIFFSFLMSVLFFKSSLMMSFLFLSCLIFIRSCFPRLRYDFNMNLFWFIILPMSMLNFVYFFYLYI